MAGMLACAVVIIIVLSPIIADNEPEYIEYETQCIYALIVSCAVAGILVLVLLLRWKGVQPGIVWKLTSVVLFILWIILAAWVTFTGPFQ